MAGTNVDQHLAALQPLRASAAVLIRDRLGQLLVLRTTYKDHWELPGGGVEPGETPRQGAEREALEELGIRVTAGGVLCVDYSPPRQNRSMAMVHFVFDAPSAEQLDIDSILLQQDEIAEYRFEQPAEAEELLGPRLGRRAHHAVAATHAGSAVYLEDGFEVAGRS